MHLVAGRESACSFRAESRNGSLAMNTDQADSYESVLMAWRADKHVLTIERASRYLAQFPDDWLILSFLGDAAHAIGRYPLAEDAFRRALAIAPPGRHFRLHRHLGDVCRWSGRIPEAEAHYRRTIAEKPGDTEGYIYLGGMLARLG